MRRKTLSLVLVGLLLNLCFLHSTAFADPKEGKLSAKAKAGIAKLGIGNESRVKVKLRDKTNVKGYISQITEDSFTVVTEKTNAVVKIPYSQVKQVKGNNMSTGVKIAIGIGIVVILLIIIGVATGGDADII